MRHAQLCMLTFAMSFAAFLRGPVAPVDQPRAPAVRQHVREPTTIDAQLDLAERIVTYVTAEYGEAYVHVVVVGVHGPQPWRLTAK